ncbi:copper amine oxidase [Syncephalastrum racemosum]|uniref:Amine oxidase n=1 Tax=Syncephalastrum racemosum TaxID=13706 RepID=A0A1X2HWF3_SYNRA|nr:copper amine oxidase [Syncephalastrum racemosum]
MTIVSPSHPLDPLTPSEIRHVAEIVRATRSPDDKTPRDYIFSSICLKEPHKDKTLAYLQSVSEEAAALMPEREALVILIDRPSGLVHEILVSITDEKVKSAKTLKNVQPTQHVLEMIEAEKIITKDPSVIEECRKLGITDMKNVYADPWTVGYHAQFKSSKRLMQALMYMRTSPDDNQYAHPLDFVPIYDVNAQKVVEILRQETSEASKYDRPTVPLENHQFLPEHIGVENLRKDIKPIEITQPEGVSFTVRGREIEWQNWSMHVGFNYREGVIINNVSYKDKGNVRPLFYRVSVSEMVVPYAHPKEPFNHKMAFDVGEYGLGNLTNSLELGCDCLGSIYYMDGVCNNLDGEPWVIPNAICIHEEDTGLLFKHTDYRTDKAHSARSRRLVISQIVTAANYDYGLYFYFYQDGTFQYEVKATGELNTQVFAEDENPAPYGTAVAPQVVGQHHQHLFMMRIDPMLDGRLNSVAQVDVLPSEYPVGHVENPIGNAFSPITTIYSDTTEAQAHGNLESSRTWKIINESKLHPYTKEPVGYKLVSPNTPPMLPKPGSLVYERAKFATKTIWVTPYDPDQIYPAGFYCSQSPGDDSMGLPAWTKEPQSVRGRDVVVWLTFGLTHIPRVEDFPVMPVETCGWALKACNFFLGNPGIDIPAAQKGTSKRVNGACCA